MATNKQIVERLFNEGLNGKNFNLFEEFIAPGFAHHGTPDPQPGPAGFRNAIQLFMNGFPDMKVNVQEVVGEGDLVATRGYWTGTQKGEFMGIPATQKQIRVDYIDWWKFQNGKAVENWAQMDIPGLMAQLGVQPGGAAAR